MNTNQINRLFFSKYELKHACYKLTQKVKEVSDFAISLEKVNPCNMHLIKFKELVYYQLMDRHLGIGLEESDDLAKGKYRVFLRCVVTPNKMKEYYSDDVYIYSLDDLEITAINLLFDLKLMRKEPEYVTSKS